MEYSNSFTYSHTFTNAKNLNSFLQQTTAISLDSTALQVPQFLNIKATKDTELTGKITLNGKAIAKLKGSQLSINLLPYLSQGINQVEILGSYKPKTSSVKIRFSGSDNLVTQQVSGNGQLQQTSIIKIRP